MKREWLHNKVTGTVYAMSDKGWINAPLFNKWFDHFLRHTPPGRPLLLLLDGHSTHYKLDTISKAMKEQVIILTLPPHSSQDTQPLDAGVFGLLKHYWSRECHKWMAKNPHKLMNKVHFNSVFSNAWAKVAVPSNAIAGFKKAGIHPLNEEAIYLCTVKVLVPATTAVLPTTAILSLIAQPVAVPSLITLSPVIPQPVVSLPARSPLVTFPPATMFPLVALATPTIIAAQ